MIVWSGWGMLVVIPWFLSLLIVQFTVDFVSRQDGYYTAHTWPKLVASVVSFPAIWFFGRWMNGSPSSPDRLTCGAKHTLYWLPMEYWAPIFFVIGIIFALE